jgi:crotonobetainyl-CoA:carnitine CoA-transferase CaiB-like acyl-CoA transferase
MAALRVLLVRTSVVQVSVPFSGSPCTNLQMKKKEGKEERKEDNKYYICCTCYSVKDRDIVFKNASIFEPQKLSQYR